MMPTSQGGVAPVRPPLRTQVEQAVRLSPKTWRQRRSGRAWTPWCPRPAKIQTSRHPTCRHSPGQTTHAGPWPPRPADDEPCFEMPAASYASIPRHPMCLGSPAC